MIEFSDEDILDAVSHSAFGKARAYVRQHRVLEIARRADGTIESKVRGTERKPYKQRIRLAPEAGGHTSIDGTCSCPIGYNCKHVAAALLALIDEPGVASPTEDELPSPAGSAPPPTLSSEIAFWLQVLDKARHADSEDYPPDIRQRLFYILRRTETIRGGIPALAVGSVSVRLRKDGTSSEKASRFNPESARQPFPAAFLRPSDRWILARLAQMPQAYSASNSSWHERTLGGESGLEILRRIINTGRARWDSITGLAVIEGPTLSGRIVWRTADEGSQRPDIIADDGSAVFRLAPASYVKLETGVTGMLDLACPPLLAQALMSAPAIAPSSAALVRAEVAKRVPGRDEFLPALLGPPEALRAPPIPHLKLFTGLLPDSYGYWHNREQARKQTSMARLSFRYGPAVIAPHEPELRPIVHHDGRLYLIERNRRAEEKAKRRLRALKLVRVDETFFWQTPEHSQDLMSPAGAHRNYWLDFIHCDVPALKTEGWSIEIAEDFQLRLAPLQNALTAELKPGSGIDWFELDLGTMLDGKRIDLIPTLIDLLNLPEERAKTADEGKFLYLPLPDGRYLPIPAARIVPIADALRALFHAGALEQKATGFGFSSLAAADLAHLEESTTAAGLVWHGAEALREMGRRLRDTGAMPAATLPGSFLARLRPYQAHGLDWLQFLRACGFGAVLADDMGLGKTVQALAHLTIEKECGRADRPSLIVCPTSLVANWRIEAERFAPSLSVLALHGSERKRRFGEIAAHDVVITTYPLLARDCEVLGAQPWHVVVLDEAQMIKNPDALTAQFARRFEARQRLCLTGTPLENHLGELWSLFTFIAPGFLGDKKSFNRRFRVAIEKEGDAERRALLARRVRPFLLRRTKAQVVLDLPPKTEIVESVELGPAQRAIYESIRLAMHARVREAIASNGIGRSQIVVLDALLKLRQACCDPRLLKLKTAETVQAGSAKLERLMEMVPALIAEGRKILLFSQFTSMLALIEQRLETAGLEYVLLTGDTEDRATPVRRFQSGAVPLFLVSLKAGGTGLNLTAADTVILYDPWWNPAVEDQAMSRAHRIGQGKPVFVHKLIALGTIEEKMEALKERKRQLIRGILDDSPGAGFVLSEADIEELLGEPTGNAAFEHRLA
jgi:superfamily II DNA or RNA helicase